MTTAVRRYADTYRDSMLLMAAARALRQSDGVSWGAALMGTAANVAALADQGIDCSGARANDLLLAVRADTEAHATRALDAAESALQRGAAPAQEGVSARRPRTVTAARDLLPEANVAVVSVPGPYATLEAHHALSAGLHVLLFSDGVPIEDEVALKSRAERLGLLLMGPGAGTAVLGGVGLGFANAAKPGPVGVVAAAGTGAQEVIAQLSAAGAGIAAVIGVGGRDLSGPVGGRMTRAGLRLLAAEPGVDVLLVVSKPPDPQVLSRAVAAAGDTPVVVAALGSDGADGAPGTLDGAVKATLSAVGLPLPDLGAGLSRLAEAAIPRLTPGRTAVRGVFSGGSLCYEALLVLARRLGRVYSNTPLRLGWDLPAPPGAHVCIDAGEEEFTASRPHPMIDAAARVELLEEAGRDPTTAVVLLDVVLGYGAHPDPAGVLAPLLADLRGAVPVVHVLGTDGDPQGLQAQRSQLAEAGCLLAPTGARAALLAAAITLRTPSVAEEEP